MVLYKALFRNKSRRPLIFFNFLWMFFSKDWQKKRLVAVLEKWSHGPTLPHLCLLPVFVTFRGNWTEQSLNIKETLEKNTW